MPVPSANASGVAAPAGPAEPPPPEEAIVIDIPPAPELPRFTFDSEQGAQLKKISELGSELGARWNQMTPELRTEKQKELRTVQADFQEKMKEKRAQFDEEMKAALDAREEHRKLVEEQKQDAKLAAQEREQERLATEREAAAEARQAARDAAAEIRTERRKLSDAEKDRLKQREKKSALLFGHRFNVPLTEQGAVVGQIHANVSAEEVIRRVLGSANEDRSEINFAVDREGNVYTRGPEDRNTLERVGILKRIAAGQRLNDIHNWVVVLHRDAQSGLRVGVARPVGEDLEELRKTAGKNFGYGMALIFVAMIGIVPIANHITRDVQLVTRGAERVAHGDLTTRLPVRSKNEFGQLATAFNRMAEDLSLQRQTIVEQERAAIEYERKSADLEEARRFQLSMLPKEVPRHDRFEIAVFTQTAAEVGGDYYDFHVEPDGVMAVTIGDATGHGARAGTMVAVIKALFAGYAPSQTPAEFLREATEKVRRMDLARMAMALQLARFEDRKVTIASAGMPPAYLHRKAKGSIEEIALGATPLGTLGADYNDVHIQLAAGDTILFLSDGFPELMNATGQQLGYAAAAEAFAVAAKAEQASEVIAALAGAVRRWHGDGPPNDDVTFVVVRAT